MTDIASIRAALIGRTLDVSLQPYHGGTARVIDAGQAHEYGRPDRLIEGKTTLVVEAIDMVETSRLFGASSTKPIPAGRQFTMAFYDVQLDAVAREGRAVYVYPV